MDLMFLYIASLETVFLLDLSVQVNGFEIKIVIMLLREAWLIELAESFLLSLVYFQP